MALPRYAKVDPLEKRIEAHEVEHALDAGHKRGADRGHRGAQAARGAHAGSVRVKATGASHTRSIHPEPARSFGKRLRVVAHARLKPLKRIGRRAFLGAKGIRGAARAGERVVHVAHDGERHMRKTRVEPREVKRRNPFEIRTDAIKLAPNRIQRPRAKRTQAAHAAVVGGAAADGQRDAACARVERRAHKLARSKGAGQKRVSLLGSKQRET